MNTIKKFRSDLFIHLDGIALTAPLACLFQSNYKVKELKNGQEINININDLSNHKINGDYLNVTLRLLESQGLLNRTWINKNTLNIKPTQIGVDFFKDIYIYEKLFSIYKDLSQLSFSNLNEYQKLNNLIKILDNINIKNKITLKHIEGLILGPILVSLFLNKQAEITDNNNLSLSEKIGLENKNFIINLFKN